MSVFPASPSVDLGAIQQFTASVTNTTSTAVTWTVNGILGGNAIVGTVTAAGLYSAPQIMPTSGFATVGATSQTNSSASGSAIVTIADGFTITLSGPSSLNSGGSSTYTATLVPAPGANPSTAINWSVTGNACGGSCGTLVTSGGNATYQAPTTATSITVTITATPAADPQKAVQISVIINPPTNVTVTVTPSNASVAVNSPQVFTAQVTGATNTNVTWDVNGIVGGNSTVGLVTNSTGSNSATYTAPSTVPSPATVIVHAVSDASTSAIGSASVLVTSGVINPNGPKILQLLPASAFAGSAGSFTIQVNGANFIATGGSAESTIYIAGSARVTSCTNANSCSTTLNAADLASAGNLAVMVQNSDGTQSNSVNFVVASETTTPGIIPLTPTSPSAMDEDIYVVEPSTAGSSAPSGNVTLAIQAMGLFVTSTATCVLGASPIVLQRPASGAATIDICVFSISGLDPSYVFSITGPTTADVIIVAKQPLGLGIVDLTLSVPSTAIAGARSLFVENANKDRAVASAALEVK